MKHLRLVAAAVVLLGVAPALAADHGARISEVGLSNNGSATVQFVEIVDVFGNEPFPNSPYTLDIFDAAGAPVGSVPLSIVGAHTGWYIATAAADTAYSPTTHNDVLTVALPANGQVCFVRNSGVKIHCLAWGCITTLLPGASRAASPADGMSAQRQADGTYQIAAPTPNAANIAGTATPACPTDPLDGPPPPDAGVPLDAPTNGNDAGVHDSGGGGGCCETSPVGGGGGAAALAAVTLATLFRRRNVKLRRKDRPRPR